MTTANRARKDITVDQVEDLYNDLSTPLLIPNGFKTLKIGLTARLAQFFITQQKRSTTTNIFKWLSPDDETKVDNVLQDPICLTALLMAKDINGSDDLPIKRELSRHLVERFQNSVHIHRRKVQMFAIDHSIEKFAYPECFYTLGAKNAQPPFYYYQIIQDYFSASLRNSNLANRDYMGLGELIAELVDNTEQHAKSDYLRGKYPRSVRATILNAHLITDEQDVDNVCGKSGPVSDYIKSFRPNNETLHMLEITLFDSGPGVYQSFPDAIENPTLAEEAKVVMESFKNGVTSKPNGFGLGRGLDRARKILDGRNGFLSIRTGRLSMYRDYKLTPISEESDIETPDIGLFDELTRERGVFSEMNSVEGVSFTILVPLQ